MSRMVLPQVLFMVPEGEVFKVGHDFSQKHTKIVNLVDFCGEVGTFA